MTRLLWIKLWRDLRGALTRIALMVIAIAVSLTAFGAVLYTRSITDREISRGYLSTNPASATILLENPVDADKLAAIAAAARTRPGIIDATARSQFTARVQGPGGGQTQANPHGGAQWRDAPLQIFVATPDDPMRMEGFEVEQGTWPPAPGQILIEQGARDLLGLKLGDTVVIKAPNGQPASLRVGGVAYDPALPPSFQEQKGYGFISTASLSGMGGKPALDELKIQVADQPGGRTPSRDRDAIAATGRSVAEWVQQTYGVAVREVQAPDPYAHPHQGQLNMLLLAMLVFGVAALLLSGVVVATMLGGLFAQQIPQIGIMKAVGARTGRILRLYLLMTLLVAAAATAVALLPGILISRLWASAVLKALLGMDAASLTAPWWTYAVVVATGLALPLLMALVPVIRTSRTTVRAAIDHHGVGPKSLTATRLDAWLGRLRGLDRARLMALRNVFRRRARFALAVGLLASAGTLFVAGMSTMSSAQAVPDQAKDQRHWDVEVQLADPVPAATLTTIAQQIPVVSRAEAWTVAGAGLAEPGQIGVTRTYPDQGHGSVGVTAVPTGSTTYTPPPLAEGRWLRPGETGAAVLTQVARATTLPKIHAGDTIQLTIAGRPTTWRIVGIANELFVGTGIYATAEGFAAATGRSDQANVLRVTTQRHDDTTRTAVASGLEQLLTNASINVRSSTSVSRTEEVSTGHMLPIVMIFLAIAIAMGVVGCVGLASTMSANVLERTREFGVMQAIGARGRAIRRIVISEGIFTALASCVVAAIPALGLTAAMGAGLGSMFLFAPLPFRISLPAVVVWIVVVVLGAALATRAPAARASRLTIREALAYL